MKCAQCPTIDHESHYNEFVELVSRKNNGADKSRLENIASKIRDRYKHYIDNKTAVEQVSVVRRIKSTVAALESCYINSQKFKSDHTEKIDENNPKPLPRCPYCQIRFADTFDHFLPSSSHPDYFVFAPNLVRVCSSCNEKKGNRTIVPCRKTIHPYFDDLQSKQFIKCIPTYSNGVLAANFCIDFDGPLPSNEAYLCNIIQEHFKYYKLNEMFRSEASGKITELKNEVDRLNSFVQVTQALARQVIIDRLQKEAEKFGAMNSWEFALWGSLMDFDGTYIYLLGN